METRRLRFPLIVILFGTSMAMASNTDSASQNQTPPWVQEYQAEKSHEKAKEDQNRRTQILAETAAKLYFAILQQDVKMILSMVDDDGGLSSQPRPMVYKEEVAKDLKSGKGHYACHLFGCKDANAKAKKTKEKPPVCIRDQLKKIPKEELAIDIQYLAEGDWAGVTFERVPDRQPASSPTFVEGDYERPLLTFRWKNSKWYVLTLFEK